MKSGAQLLRAIVDLLPRKFRCYDGKDASRQCAEPKGVNLFNVSLKRKEKPNDSLKKTVTDIGITYVAYVDGLLKETCGRLRKRCRYHKGAWKIDFSNVNYEGYEFARISDVTCVDKLSSHSSPRLHNPGLYLWKNHQVRIDDK